MLTTISKLYNWKAGKMLYLPESLTSDSQFPLTSTAVAIKVVGKQLIVENLK